MANLPVKSIKTKANLGYLIWPLNLLLLKSFNKFLNDLKFWAFEGCTIIWLNLVIQTLDGLTLAKLYNDLSQMTRRWIKWQMIKWHEMSLHNDKII